MTGKTKRSLIYTAVLTVFLLGSGMPVMADLPGDADLVGMSFDEKFGLAVLSRYELFNTADGKDWKPAGLMDRVEALSSVAVSRGMVLVGTEAGDILRSVEGGPYAAVKRPRDPYGRAVAPIKYIAIHPKGVEVLASSGQGLIRSKDKGATWEPVADPFWSNPEAREVTALGYVKGGAVIVTRGGVYRQTKNGYEPVTKGLPDKGRPTAAAILGGKALLAMPGEGIFLATRNSAFKKLKEAPGDPLAFVGLAAKSYLAARPTTALHRSDSKGRKWEPVGTGISPGFVPRFSASTGFGDFVILRGKGLMRLEEGSFVPVPMPIPLSSVYAMHETVWKTRVAGTRGGVYFSPAAGRGWQDVTPADLGVAVNVFLPLDGERILLGAEGAGVYQSADMGKTWEKYSRGLGTANTIRGLVRYDGGVLAGTENGLMWVDGGAQSNWGPRDGGIGRLSITALIRDGDSLLAATQKGLFRAADGKDFALMDGFKGSATAAALSGDRILAVVNGKVLLSEGGNKPIVLPKMPVRAVVVDTAFYEGKVYAATTKGVFRWDGSAWKQAGSMTYPAQRFVRQEKGLAFPTRGAGTYKLY